MKIAFPTQEKKGIESLVHGHFGSAHYFVIVDTEDNSTEIVENPDRDHLHGHCQPLKALNGRTVDAVIVGGIGGGALRKLLMEGIKVYRAAEGPVSNNLELLISDKLPVFTPDQTCGGHGIGDSCPH
ncbi:MAG: NifB/NifX family molybdenum-iron cluster-binding protein [Desulfobacterales bacterium]|jgi:predicted Fe-Mo cluster-binding NifX family protein